MIKKSQGFTLIEVIIVVTILAILAVTSVTVITGYQRDTEVVTMAETIVSNLRQAQSKSITGEGTSTWGVHFDTANPNEHFIALFQGTAYGSGTDVEQTSLLHGARLSNLSLNGAGNDVLFDRLTGGTSQYGTGASSRAVCVTNTVDISGCKKGIIITQTGRTGLQ